MAVETRKNDLPPLDRSHQEQQLCSLLYLKAKARPRICQWQELRPPRASKAKRRRRPYPRLHRLQKSFYQLNLSWFPRIAATFLPPNSTASQKAPSARTVSGPRRTGKPNSNGAKMRVHASLSSFKARGSFFQKRQDAFFEIAAVAAFFLKLCL